MLHFGDLAGGPPELVPGMPVREGGVGSRDGAVGVI